MRALVVVLFLAAISESAWADTITIKADVWCPYNCDPKDKNPGFMIELAKLAFEKAGHTVQYETLNWARAIDETRKGKHTAIVGAFKSDAEDFIFPATALGRSKTCFFVKTGNKWRFTNYDDFKGKILVGVIKDYSYTEEMDKFIKANPTKFDPVSGDEGLVLNIKKLTAGRLDTFMDDSNVVSNHVQATKTDGSIKEAGCVKDADVYIAFSPTNPKGKAYAQILSDTVDQARKSGELKTILAKYGLTDWR